MLCKILRRIYYKPDGPAINNNVSEGKNKQYNFRHFDSTWILIY